MLLFVSVKVHLPNLLMQGPVLFDMNGTRSGLTGIYQLSKLLIIVTAMETVFLLMVKDMHTFVTLFHCVTNYPHLRVSKLSSSTYSFN